MSGLAPRPTTKTHFSTNAVAFFLLTIILLFSGSSFIWFGILILYLLYFISLVSRRKKLFHNKKPVLYIMMIITYMIIGALLLVVLKDAWVKCNYTVMLDSSDILRFNKARELSRFYYSGSLFVIISALYLSKKYIAGVKCIYISVAILPAIILTGYLGGRLFPLYENTDDGMLVYEQGVYNYKTETSHLAFCDDERNIEKNELYEKVDTTNGADVLFVLIIILTMIELLISRGNNVFYSTVILLTPFILIRRYVVMLLEYNGTFSFETVGGILLRIVYTVIVIYYIVNLKYAVERSHHSSVLK